MKTFVEWMADRHEPITHNLTHFSSYKDFLDVIKQAIKYVNTNMDDDRVEFDVFGTKVMVWRTRINGQQKFHVGLKFDYDTDGKYRETTPDQLAYFLHNYWTSNKKPSEPKGGLYHGRPLNPNDVRRHRLDNFRRLNTQNTNMPKIG
jgi:hypothetical protein